MQHNLHDIQQTFKRQRHCFVSQNMLSKADLELEKHLAGAVCSFVSAEKLQPPIKRCFPLKGSPT